MVTRADACREKYFNKSGKFCNDGEKVVLMVRSVVIKFTLLIFFSCTPAAASQSRAEMPKNFDINSEERLYAWCVGHTGYVCLSSEEGIVGAEGGHAIYDTFHACHKLSVSPRTHFVRAAL